MKLENQCCTISQGEKLMALGVEGLSLFKHWHNTLHDNYFLGSSDIDTEFAWCLPVCNAWNVSELGAMIGNGNKTSEKHWQWLLDCVNSGLSGTVAYNAVALAGFVITRLEEGILTAEEVNNRLAAA